MKIIKLDENNIPDIARIEHECFVHPWSEQSIMNAIRAGHTFFGCEKDSVLCGFAGVNIVCGECYVDNVAVSEKYRGSGIGKALMTELISYCKMKNADFVTLEVRCSNKSAIALYESLGFECTGVRPKFYTSPTEDAKIFKLITNKKLV